MNQVYNFIAGILSVFGVEADSLVAGSGHRLFLLFLSLLFSWFVDWVTYSFVRPLVKRLVSKTHALWDDYLLNDTVLHSSCRLIPPVIILIAFSFIYAHGHVIPETERVAANFVERIIKVYLVIMVIRWGFGFLNGVRKVAEQHASQRSYLTGLFQLVKIAILFIGTIIIIGILIDRSPLALIAGLGALATVLMLIFKDPILGMVSGVQLSANDMLRKGDWITMNSSGANGIVEEVTLTTVKVRNFDNTITTIPPYTLVSQSFQNWRAMQQSGGRRVKRAIYIDMQSVRLCTDEERQRYEEKGWIDVYVDSSQLVNLTVFRNVVEKYLRSLAQINQNLRLMVRQLEPTPQGLPLELYFYLYEKEWTAYEHQVSDIMAQVLVWLPQFGLQSYQMPAGTDFNKKSDGYLSDGL